MFASHSWPSWGKERIQEVIRTQRDTYAHLNNEVLHLANQGVTINKLHNIYQLPQSLQNQWAAHSYHGSKAHNSLAVINRYLGYWDANPATLIPLSPGDSAPLYVELMGGSGKMIDKGKPLYQPGKYLQAMEILNNLVYAEPNNTKAKDLLAEVSRCISKSATRKKAPASATASLVPPTNYATALRRAPRLNPAAQT